MWYVIRLDDRGVCARITARASGFSRLSSIQPLIQWLPFAVSLEVKRPRREADHSPQGSAVLRKHEYTNFCSHICIHAVIIKWNNPSFNCFYLLKQQCCADVSVVLGRLLDPGCGVACCRERVKRPIHSRLNWTILMCDVIPDGKLSKLRSFDRQ